MVDEFTILEPFCKDHVRHGVGERDVGADADRHMGVRNVRRERAARIDDDHARAIAHARAACAGT